MTVKEVAAFLRAHDSYLILTHRRPDGGTAAERRGHEPLCRLRRALLGGGGLPL